VRTIRRTPTTIHSQCSWPVASAAAVLLLVLATPAEAAEVEWVKVKRKDGRIDIKSEITIDAPAPEVYDALLEYDKFADLSEDFTESRYIEPAEDGAPRIYTRIEGCIWFFCKTIERYARLDLEPKWKITATGEPDKSDAALSIESWSLSANGNNTVIDYSHEIETGFWVPPLIGTWIIGSSVKRSALSAAIRIEELAIAALEQQSGMQASRIMSRANLTEK
jgi:hypothetical protein